jgi:hypothetical protein
VVSPGTPVSSTSKTDRHDITEILKVALNTIHLATLASFNLDILYRPEKSNSDYIIS